MIYTASVVGSTHGSDRNQTSVLQLHIVVKTEHILHCSEKHEGTGIMTRVYDDLQVLLHAPTASEVAVAKEVCTEK
jgi:hypothetical protein